MVRIHQFIYKRFKTDGDYSQFLLRIPLRFQTYNLQQDWLFCHQFFCIFASFVNLVHFRTVLF